MIEGVSYTISVDGTEVTERFSPYLLSLALRLYDGGMSDALELLLDDLGGRIKLPRVGADISVKLAWKSGGQAVNFQGTTDEPHSRGGRSEGFVLALTASGVDFVGPAKQKQQGHADNMTFEQAAQKWAKTAGLTVQVDSSLAKIRRDYWQIGNESFLAWGKRVAEEIGATFKVFGTRAVFVPRNSGSSTSGRALAGVSAVYGQNLVYWDLTPLQSRPRYKTAVVWLYNPKTGKYEQVQASADSAAKSSHVDTRRFPNRSQAQDRADANADEIARGKGGGAVIIDGEAAAQPQAPLTLSGVRSGIDGEYRITGVVHRLARSSGWLTEMEVEEPQGAAGEDAR
ncbi:phage late control D family protein [Methylosinus sp. PW1]|uniref:phage late control D family protein n=1 Tax=Methylosinus sp. PW1 TaxID=107636 RepID=UPI00056498B7|nr:hypothetical protein [Methylosinus sp. PW1]